MASASDRACRSSRAPVRPRTTARSVTATPAGSEPIAARTCGRSGPRSALECSAAASRLSTTTKVRKRAHDGFFHLLLPDRHEERDVFLEPCANRLALFGIVLDEFGIASADVEVDEGSTARRTAQARIALRLVLRHPAVENRDFFAG